MTPAVDKALYKFNDSVTGTIKDKVLVEDESQNELKLYFVKENTEYRTEYYLQQTDGTYILAPGETSTWTVGAIGTSASATIKTFAGYTKVTVNNDVDVSRENITALAFDRDDNVMKVYYNLNTSYKVEYYYQKADRSFGTTPDSVSADRVEVAGNTAAVTEADKTPTESDYAFDNGNINNVLTTIVKPDGTTVLKVYFVKEDTRYKTEYYLQQSDGSYVKDSSSEWTDAKVGDSVVAADKTFTGYTKVNVNNGSDKTVDSIASLVKDENSNVMRLYYNKNTTYKVEYYYEKEDGSFEKKSESPERDGVSGDTVSVTSGDKTPVIDGYQYDDDNAGKVETIVLKPDGDNVLEVYFERKPTEYKTEYYLQNTDGTYSKANETAWKSGKVGDSVTAESRSFTDYQLTTTPSTIENIASIKEEKNENIMKLYYNRNTTYKVEYYYQKNDGSFGTTPDSVSEDRPEVAGNTASVTEADKTPTKSGYAFDNGNEKNVLASEVKPDGTTVLKVYFAKEDTRYKTEYYLQQLDGSYVKDSSSDWTDAKVGDSVVATDKTFTGYTKVTVNNGTDETIDSIASLVKDENSNVMKLYYNRNTTYKVEYYYEKEDGSFEKVSESTPRDAVAGKVVSVTTDDKIPEIDGYMYDADNKQQLIDEVVNADGTTTLKVYFVYETPEGPTTPEEPTTPEKITPQQTTYKTPPVNTGDNVKGVAMTLLMLIAYGAAGLIIVAKKKKKEEA